MTTKIKSIILTVFSIALLCTMVIFIGYLLKHSQADFMWDIPRSVIIAFYSFFWCVTTGLLTISHVCIYGRNNKRPKLLIAGILLVLSVAYMFVNDYFNMYSVINFSEYLFALALIGLPTVALSMFISNIYLKCKKSKAL